MKLRALKEFTIIRIQKGYALEDLENFKTVITSADVITTVDDCIKKINLYLAKVRPDEYSPFI